MGGDGVDYYDIGQRIRRVRRAKGLSQEALAEKIGISTTHMSHIETANTKLSLPVFISIAETLEVSTESLLYDAPREGINAVAQEINGVLESCTAKEAKMIVRGKVILPSLGKDFFHRSVSSFLHESVSSFFHDSVRKTLHRSVSRSLHQW